MSDSELKHRVIINDIPVGEISDDELIDIQSSGYFDKKIYFKQAINSFWVIFKSMDALLLTLPAMAFWIFVGVAVLNPEAITEFIAHVRKTALEVVIKDALDVLLTFWFLGWMLQCLILRRVPGFSNEFREATYSHIRTKLELQSGGKMSLLPIETF